MFSPDQDVSRRALSSAKLYAFVAAALAALAGAAYADPSRLCPDAGTPAQVETSKIASQRR